MGDYHVTDVEFCGCVSRLEGPFHASLPIARKALMQLALVGARASRNGLTNKNARATLDRRSNASVSFADRARETAQCTASRRALWVSCWLSGKSAWGTVEVGLDSWS